MPHTGAKSATYLERQKQLAAFLRKNSIDSLLIPHLPHIRYLTGFSGETALLLLLKKGRYALFTDFRFTEQAENDLSSCKNIELKVIENDYWETLSAYLAKHGITSLGYQPRRLTCFQFAELRKRNASLKLVAVSNTCEAAVNKKSAWEIGYMAKAAAIADALFPRLCAWYKKGLPERQVAALLEFESRMKGSDGFSFPAIIASGKNSSLPHAQAGAHRIKRGNMVLADYGMRYNGYCSDMTRTVFFGRAPARFREIYQVVLEAQARALACVRAGAPCCDVDRAAREVIEKAGYGKEFGHALGHGVGIEVHEEPRISKTSKSLLEPGMVITIEPGIYLPGWGGVRIEDMVVVTETGYKNLVTSPKKLIEL